MGAILWWGLRCIHFILHNVDCVPPGIGEVSAGSRLHLDPCLSLLQLFTFGIRPRRLGLLTSGHSSRMSAAQGTERTDGEGPGQGRTSCCSSMPRAD